MAVLEAHDLAIRFGGLQALRDFSIQVNEWEIVGLIGPNGAGKTTAFNCITGFYKPDSGRVLHRGKDVTGLAPHQRVTEGFGRTFQNVGMVKTATAVENLRTAQHIHAEYSAMAGILGAPVARATDQQLTDRADQLLEFLGLTHIRNLPVGSLSYGQMKLLELGCAMATDPDILLLDEPSSGMGPEEAHDLGQRLLTLRNEVGLTMLLIEHHVPLVTTVCDYVYVLNFGSLLAEGEPAAIQRHPAVIEAYLGSRHAVVDESTESAESGESSEGASA